MVADVHVEILLVNFCSVIIFHLIHYDLNIKMDQPITYLLNKTAIYVQTGQIIYS